jgi:hypothetical protein
MLILGIADYNHSAPPTTSSTRDFHHHQLTRTYLARTYYVHVWPAVSVLDRIFIDIDKSIIDVDK